ncbi:MAG: deoxyribodipyrimidine photolyase [Polyangiaceae bacterium]|jgi:deoxyribodipyrimidine photolyase-related protein|nr:deoxyribodipyrimidine photolyase [Polyangiaceae bacterium]
MTFRAALRAYGTAPSERDGRRWLFVPYDQLTDAVGPLSRDAPESLGIVLVECPEKAGRRPYHQQKLALLLTNLRHFALEQAARGVSVRHVVASSYVAALQAHPGPLEMMRPAERELRAELAPLVDSGKLRLLPHEGWLTTSEDFRQSQSGPPWRMDAFYREVRRRTGLLMHGGQPLGGRFSFDTDNRQPWRGEPAAPAPPTFEVDDITREVCSLVRERFAHHPGTLTPERLPATRADAQHLWAWAKRECLPSFGPFEDAMSTRSRALFHTQVSALLNLQRISAHQLVAEVSADPRIPLASQEGFVRQILGWREYMHHVHDATDGFRVLAGVVSPSARVPGDGGYARWAGTPWPTPEGGDGGSLASHLGAQQPLPPAYWGARSGLHCLDTVIASVWQDGYSHHITRLMVLSNLAMLLDVAPRELTDWFWAAYVDAYDWVVEPNVHGMGTFGVGDLLTTKPYIAGAAYIDRMSDYCEHCRFDPKTTCPITPLYWAYLGRHRAALQQVPRLKLPMAAEAKRADAQKQADARIYEETSQTLVRGGELAPKQRTLF